LCPVTQKFIRPQYRGSSCPRDAQRDNSKRAIKTSLGTRKRERNAIHRHVSIEWSCQIRHHRREEKASRGDQHLRHGEETKSVDSGKCSWMTMNGEGEWGSSRRTSDASQALVPAEAPMSALGSGENGWLGGHRVMR